MVYFLTNLASVASALFEDILRQDSSSSLVERFGAALPLIGLGELAITPSLSKTLQELQAARNIIVHNGGVVDLHFKKTCPFIDLAPETVGQSFVISQARIDRFTSAPIQLVALVMKRIIDNHSEMACD